MGKAKARIKEKELKIKFSKKAVLAIVIIALLVIAAYLVLKKPGVAKQGDTVLVDYTGMFQDNKIFDTTDEGIARAAGIYHSERQYGPIEVVIGAGRFIPGFEDALYGMREGEKKTVTIPPERAYGGYDPKKIVSLNRSVVRAENLTAGDVVTSGSQFFKVLYVNETDVLIDANAPLAGKTLTFEITLVKIGK